MLTEKLLGAAGNAATAANYIEDVFSTWLYTGTGAVQTITNGIDLAGKGGMVWTKGRSTARDPNIVDTVRGGNNMMYTDSTSAQFGLTGLGYSAYTFGSTGYTNSGAPVDSENTYTFASWTFRKQPKFFDIVTYTGTGSVQNISHNLGSVPGCIIVKRTDSTGQWFTYHRQLNGGTNPGACYLLLNTTDSQFTGGGPWNNTDATSTQFTVGASNTTNFNGGTYIAYIFAHNAGGFGLTGTDNVISCGSFLDTDTSKTLGFEPQWILYKNTTTTGDWIIADTMRGDSVYSSGSNAKQLYPNQSAAEAGGYAPYPTATGFNIVGVPAGTYIYIAIRRGPMKVPTDATKVFSPQIATPVNGTVITTNFPVDLTMITERSQANAVGTAVYDRLRGESSTSANVLYTPFSYAEGNLSGYGIAMDSNVSIGDYISRSYFSISSSTSYWNFQRAPSFFDEVCYTGTGSATTVTHNLGVVPELIIVKDRNSSTNWPCYNSTLGAANYIYLNGNAAYGTTSAFWNNTTPTSTVFSLGSGNRNVNYAGDNYVAYLFATCAGVSKVGSYTGNGTTQAISCGFAGGARFVLIKRTDNTGDWYVYDTARGMTTLTDPYLLLDSTAAESATLGSVTTTTGGFTVNASILAAINTNAASYIFLAIA